MTTKGAKPIDGTEVVESIATIIRFAGGGLHAY